MRRTLCFAALALGINTYAGKVTCDGVARAHKMEYVPIDRIL